MKALCIAHGLPVIDSRDVPFEAVWKLAVNGPMIAVGHAADEPPWHALSDAPLRIVAEAYRAAGAEVLNLPGESTRPPSAPDRADPSPETHPPERSQDHVRESRLRGL